MMAEILTLILWALSFMSVTGQPDTYSAEELKILPELMKRVKSDLTQSYMADNRYLVRFLRARQLDIDKAEEMLRKSFQWRKKLRLDGIISEDFSYWEKLQPHWFCEDRDGRPAIVSGIAGINIRKIVLNGKGSELMRYIYYGLERELWMYPKIFNETGRNFVNGHLLFNLNGYQHRTHACLACLPLFVELATSYENYYPGLGNLLFVINCPRIFQVVLDFVRPFITPETIAALRIYGFNKEEYTREILTVFPPENIFPEFGGTLSLAKS